MTTGYDQDGFFWEETQIGTRAAPTLDTEGLDLRPVLAVRLIIQAPAAQTFTGVGNLDFWVYDTRYGWSKSPLKQQALSGVADGLFQLVFDDYLVGATSGRMLVAFNGVTFSGGTDGKVILRAARRGLTSALQAVTV